MKAERISDKIKFCNILMAREKMPVIEKLMRFARKPITDKLAVIKATFDMSSEAGEKRRLHRLFTGANGPPNVFAASNKIYVAYRPDSDVGRNDHPELELLSEKWIYNNVMNNAGDLPRLYALIMNIKQVLNDDVGGDFGELGVYKGNSAALFAHYARQNGKRVVLFDTFDGFDPRDLVGPDASKKTEFADTSLERVRDFLGEDGIRFVRGRFPDCLPSDLDTAHFCVAHIDCDLYEPAKAGLEYFYPRLSPGGVLIMHDYASPYWGGIKQAVDEYCRRIPERPVIFGDKSGTAMIRKSIQRS